MCTGIIKTHENIMTSTGIELKLEYGLMTST